MKKFVLVLKAFMLITNLRLKKYLKKKLKNFDFKAFKYFEIKNQNKNTFLGLIHKNFFKKQKIEFDISTNSIRDFLSIKSLITIIIKKIEKKEIFGTFNVGSQKGYKIKDIIKYYFGEKLISSKK